MKKILMVLIIISSVSAFAQNVAYKSTSSVVKTDDTLHISISGEAAEVMFKKGIEANGVVLEKDTSGIKTTATRYASFGCVKVETRIGNQVRFQCGVEILDQEI